MCTVCDRGAISSANRGVVANSIQKPDDCNNRRPTTCSGNSTSDDLIYKLRSHTNLRSAKRHFFQEYATITLTKQLILNTFLQRRRRRHHHHHHQVVCIAASLISLIACCHAQVTQNAGNIKKKFRKKIPGSGSGSGWLPEFNVDFLVQRYMYGKKFHEFSISSFLCVKLLREKHTNKRMFGKTYM